MTKLILLVFSFAMLSCGQKGSSETTQVTEVKPAVTTASPTFDADSAYAFVDRQVAFGPRVPNTQGHKDCGNYLAAELERFGAKVYQQEATLRAYDGTPLDCRNIIGSFNPDKEKRILLFAHWDTRPYSDEDPNPANLHKAIDGADDGGSGVGALLEIARQIGMKAPNVGIDIIFFDAEDYGTPHFAEEKYNYPENDWCLGTQFWAKNPHVPNYKAEFGILLDMVGAKDAVFYKEQESMKYAARYVDEVWETARNLGYGKYFINGNGGLLVDDHIYVISGRGIPCLDIINYDPKSNKGFRDHWHTQNDNMQNIDRNVLKAVGQTVMEVVYNRLRDKRMTINELQDNIIEEFSVFDDWMDKYALLIDLGNSLPPLEEKYKTESNLIEGCQSRVWLQAEYENGLLTFKGESDAVIVKGIVSLLINILSGHTPQEILEADLYFIEKIGLKEHLSPTRSNGLVAMVKQMRMYALAFKTKEQNA